MTTSSQTNRFASNFTMGGTKDAKGDSLGNWQSSNNIWAPSASDGYSKRESRGSRGSDETFPNTMSGTAPRLPTFDSELSSWGVNNGSWKSHDSQTLRNPSGNTSPTRTRDLSQGMHDIASNTASYFTNSRPAVGQGSTFKSKPSTGMEQAPAAYPKLSPPYDSVADDKENSDPFVPAKFERSEASQNFRGPARLPEYLSGMANTQESGISSTRQLDQDAYRSAYGMATYGSQSTSGTTNMRSGAQPSTSVPRHPSRQQSLSRNGQMDEEAISGALHRGLSLNEASGHANPGLQYNTGPNPLQFNPGAQAWDGATAPSRPLGIGLQSEPFADTVAANYASVKRNSIAERGPTPAGSYRGSSSPRTYTPPVADAWSRPSSRDLSMAAESGRRAQNQAFSGVHPQYYPQNYYPQAGLAHFPNLLDYWMPPQVRPPIAGSAHLMPYQIAQQQALSMRIGREQDPAKGSRSLLLEEYRSNPKSSRRFELKDIYGHVVEFGGDQHGSRFIQQKLESANSDEKDQVFREIEPNAIPLMKDVFGNYVIQKFFEHGTQAQKKMLAGQMKGKVEHLSKEMYACRVVQKALDTVLEDQREAIEKELAPEVLRIIRDQNGNHVIQKVIEVEKDHTDRLSFIMDAIRHQVVSLASHNYGCRVVQRLLDYGSSEQKKSVLAEIETSTNSLIVDQYGNYVAQHVIQNGEPSDRSNLIALVTEQVLQLSKHKFASNVVEKCIEFGSVTERRQIMEKIMALGKGEDTTHLQSMIKDQYGNYVIQKLLNSLDGSDKARLVQLMKPNLQMLKKSSTGRQSAAIDRLMDAITKAEAKLQEDEHASVSDKSPTHAGMDSAMPTPILTMETNTPQSSSPPSTDSSVPDAPIPSPAKSSSPVTAPTQGGVRIV